MIFIWPQIPTKGVVSDFYYISTPSGLYYALRLRVRRTKIYHSQYRWRGQHEHGCPENWPRTHPTKYDAESLTKQADDASKRRRNGRTPVSHLALVTETQTHYYVYNCISLVAHSMTISESTNGWRNTQKKNKKRRRREEEWKRSCGWPKCVCSSLDYWPCPSLPPKFQYMCTLTLFRLSYARTAFLDFDLCAAYYDLITSSRFL